MNEDRVLLFLALCAFAQFITVSTNGYKNISGPFMQLEKQATLRLTITKPRLRHYLHCEATIEESFFHENDTSFFYTWYRNDKKISGSWELENDFKVFQNGTLRLPATETASGEYRCKITGSDVALISESIIVVYPVLKRSKTATTIKAFPDFSLTIECPMISEPAANISWYYENNSLTNISNESRIINPSFVILSYPYQRNRCSYFFLRGYRYIVLTNGSLILRRVSLKDDGKYKCVAHNQFAVKKFRQFIWTLSVANSASEFLNVSNSTSKSLNVSVLIPSIQESTQYIAKGENITLRCYGVNSSVNIDWWFQSTAHGALLKVYNKSTEYKIFHASIDNQGFYICTTQADRQTFRIIITEPPTIVESLPSYETLITASLTFTCKTRGSPIPSITWYHNGALFNNSFTRYINGNELIIHSFDPGEDGMYQCFARNVAGEVYSTAEIRFRHKKNELVQENPMKKIQCFPHSFNTINITFESETTETMFILHIIQKNPHRWTSPFAPMKLNHTSYVVISSHLPIYRPFELITRVLFPTSEIRAKSKPQQLIQSSLRSNPVTCCTQGLLLHLVQLDLSSIFLTWSQPELNNKKYFILQFSIKHTKPHPKYLMKLALRGTTQNVQLNAKDIEKKLEPIFPLDEKTSHEILSRAEKENIHKHLGSSWETSNDIYNIVVYANVSGIELQNFTRLKLRVLIITLENENLKQDFRYVQWKEIENGTTEVVDTPFRLSIVESRMIGFQFDEIFNESCVEVCLWQIQFPIIHKEQPKCEQRLIVNSFLTIDSLKPTERYRLNFFNCQSQILYGQLDVKTLPDPPGTISNQRIIRHDGLKLIWDPPLRPNGKVYYYKILWSLGNITHEKNVPTDCPRVYKFPNLSESSKINVSIRVVGETGIGAPVFIDLRNINHHRLEIEQSSKQTVYSGIIIGAFLSFLCIFCFALLFILQRRHFKPQQQVAIHLSAHSDANFGNLNSAGLPRSMTLNENSFQQDYFEMQTLIPKSVENDALRNNLQVRQNAEYPTSSGNYLLHRGNTERRFETERVTVDLDDIFYKNRKILKSNVHISPTQTGCHQYPELSDHKFLCLSMQSDPLTTIVQEQNLQSSLQVDDASLHDENVTNMHLKTLSIRYAPLKHSNTDKLLHFNKINTVATANNQNNKKHFIPNCSNNSQQTDVIYLLAEEESISTLTPILEINNIGVGHASDNQMASIHSKQNKESSNQRKIIQNNNNSFFGESKKQRIGYLQKTHILNCQAGEFSKDDSLTEQSCFSKNAPRQGTRSNNWTRTFNTKTRRPNLDPNG